jgi:hypothetical protein
VAITTNFRPEAPHDRRHSAVVSPPVALGPEDPPPELETPFRWSLRSPAGARRFVTETMAAWGCDALINDCALIVTELATNAVLHARTGFTVALSRRPAGLIRISVRDTSPMRPRPRHAGPLAASGRGLSLVEALADGWGADLVPGGKVVWAELEEACAGRSRPAGAALTAS